MKQSKLVNYYYIQQYLNLLFESQRDTRHKNTGFIGFDLYEEYKQANQIYGSISQKSGCFEELGWGSMKGVPGLLVT